MPEKPCASTARSHALRGNAYVGRSAPPDREAVVTFVPIKNVGLKKKGQLRLYLQPRSSCVAFAAVAEHREVVSLKHFDPLPQHLAPVIHVMPQLIVPIVYILPGEKLVPRRDQIALLDRGEIQSKYRPQRGEIDDHHDRVPTEDPEGLPPRGCRKTLPPGDENPEQDCDGNPEERIDRQVP